LPQIPPAGGTLRQKYPEKILYVRQTIKFGQNYAIFNAFRHDLWLKSDHFYISLFL